MGDEDQRSAVIAWLHSPAKPMCAHPDGIGRHAEPLAGLCIGQPFRHGLSAACAGDQRPNVRAHVRLQHGMVSSVAIAPYTTQSSRTKPKIGQQARKTRSVAALERIRP
jgi:hypothetical protein